MSDRERLLEELHMDIHEYADDDTEYGWLLVNHEGRNYRFPKRALIHFVFGNMKPLEDLLPEYEAFSPMGVKLQMDNTFHTDVWIGAGFDLEAAYDHDSPENAALHYAVTLIEKEMKDIVSFDFTILANGLKLARDRSSMRMFVYEYGELPKNTTSSINVNCADAPREEWDEYRAIVLPNASIEYDQAARNADVIITEVGGQMAHLSIVSREKGKILIRVDNAVKRFPPFSRLRLDFNNLTLECVGR